jgi:hypothetical protein
VYHLTGPRELMPNLLRHISDWTPPGAAVHALLLGGFAIKQFKWE